VVALKHAALPGDRGVLNPLLEKWQDGVRTRAAPSTKAVHTRSLSHSRTSPFVRGDADYII
jgi:hypothetical protein